MLSKLKKQDNKGFTIIEVMIVLAIAGLIILIVFLAIPALQRNSRNTQRKSDAGRISASVSNYVSNTSGNLPVTGSTDLAKIMTDAGNLGQFGSLTATGDNATACTATSLADTKFTECKGAAITFTALTNSQAGMVLAVQAQCDTTTSGAIVTGTSRQSALVYSLEGGSGGQVACVSL